MKEIYLDHAAATYLDPRVIKAMAPYWEANFGNPSSLYKVGRKAKAALDEARKTVARLLHAQTAEIVFTGSGTESDNLAILGVCKAWEESQTAKLSRAGKTAVLGKKRHIIISSIEHSAVLNTCRELEKQGYAVTYLPVNGQGLVEVETVKKAIRPDTLLVSVMYANNEIGTVQPIAEIAAICRQNKVYFHTDACQAAGFLPLDVQKLGVDLLTLNASKIYGPKGVGALYVRQGVPIRPILYGGGQEKGLRSGTENIPGIVGLAKALELVVADQSRENQRLTKLRDYFIKEVLARVPEAKLNGHPTKRLPNNINFTFPGLDAEAIVLLMDEAGVACATGSACDTAVQEPSHVLKAIGAGPGVRFTLGKRTSRKELDYTLKQLSHIVSKLV